VSCDPATLARDIARLSGLGFTPQEYQPVDMFPHTPQVGMHQGNACKSGVQPDLRQGGHGIFDVRFLPAGCHITKDRLKSVMGFQPNKTRLFDGILASAFFHCRLEI